MQEKYAEREQEGDIIFKNICSLCTLDKCLSDSSVPSVWQSLWLTNDSYMQYETGGFDHCAVHIELAWQHSTVLILVIPQKKLTIISALTRKYPVMKKCTKILS